MNGVCDDMSGTPLCACDTGYGGSHCDKTDVGTAGLRVIEAGGTFTNLVVGGAAPPG